MNLKMDKFLFITLINCVILILCTSAFSDAIENNADIDSKINNTNENGVKEHASSKEALASNKVIEKKDVKPKSKKKPKQKDPIDDVVLDPSINTTCPRCEYCKTKKEHSEHKHKFKKQLSCFKVITYLMSVDKSMWKCDIKKPDLNLPSCNGKDCDDCNAVDNTDDNSSDDCSDDESADDNCTDDGGPANGTETPTEVTD